jgi:hypothetical protein
MVPKNSFLYCKKTAPIQIKESNWFMNLAKEVGRLHATGFFGVIESIDNVSCEINEEIYRIGFLPSNNIYLKKSFFRTRQKKEIRILIDELSCELSSAEVSDFVMKYNEILKRA